MFSKLKNLIALIFLIMAVFAVGNFALAADANSLLWGGQEGAIGNALGLGSQDPRIIAASIIRVVLGFLGIVALGLVIYAGWLWMTAGGEREKIDKAKKVLVGALIGILIILASFAITTYILGRLYEATGGVGGGPCTAGATRPCGCGGTQVCVGGVWDVCVGSTCGGAGSFYVTSAMPTGSTVMNVKVRYYFSNNVDSSTVGSATFSVVGSVSGSIAGGRQVTGRRLEFVPAGACPPNSCGATECFPANETITVTATNGIWDTGGATLTCTILRPCTITFTTNDLVDCNKPAVSLLYDNQTCLNTINNLGSSAFDDSGVSQVEFTDSNGGSAFTGVSLVPCPGPGPCGQVPPDSPWEVPLGTVTWQPISPTYSAGTDYTITVTADDLDANQAAASKTFRLRPDYCCNGVEDGDEEGVDCGGSCAGCLGTACAIDEAGAPATSCDDNLCASGFCTPSGSSAATCSAAGYGAGIDSCCLCQAKPRIDWISPVDALGTPNGAAGNLITIGGINFGASQGEVIFGGSDTDGNADAFGDADDVVASFPNTLNSNCTNNWQDNQIIVVVPGLPAVNGPIEVVTSASYEDATNDSYGPFINDFEINSTVRPGLCLANPDSGYFGNTFNLQGIQFNGADRSVNFGSAASNVPANNISNWSNTAVEADVPNIKAAKTTVFVAVDGESSNYLQFQVLYEVSKMPSIDYIDPNPAPPGQYVTIYGSNFKSYLAGTSKVKFEFESDPTFSYEIVDASALNAECQDSWWRDNYIIVKVPPRIQSDGTYGSFNVFVTNREDITSTREAFDAPNQIPGPGLCKLDPYNGPVGTQVNAFGDNFGAVQGSGFLRYYNNIDITTSLPNWSWSNQSVVSNVPSGAQTGPVRVSNGSNLSNPLNFTVGKCEPANPLACLGGDECCAGGSWDGICRPAGTCGEGLPTACTYGWTFSTAPGAITPPTCAGYSTANQCLAADMCPNTPGQCQTKSATIVGGCQNVDCDNKYADCTTLGAGCTYNLSTNRCEIEGFVCNQTNTSLLPPYRAQCRLVSSLYVWQIDITGSCPAGSFKDTNGWCTVGTIGSPLTCTPTLCSNNFSCSQLLDGECISKSGLCPAGSKCNAGTSQCETTDICECCCRVGFDAQDCCSGLACQAGGCGSDPINYGLCTGCKVELDGNPLTVTAEEQAVSDQACNCYGNESRYCDLADPSYPNGVCRDKRLCDSNPYNGADVCDPDSALCSSGEYCDPSSCFCEQAEPCDSDTTTAACNPLDNLCPSVDFIEYCDPTSCLCQPKYCDSDPIAPGCTADPTACDLVTEYCDNISCVCKPLTGAGGPGELCIPPLPPPTCTVGATSCLTDYSCLNNNDCRCCCDPTTNPPQVNAAGLVCSADRAPCDCATPPCNRGLYCGCSSDAQCVDTLNVGCSFDTCCRNRPTITNTSPLDGSTNICRNALITATFDQIMDISSFTGNVIVVGDYGAGVCPAGTQYILAGGLEQRGFFNRLFSQVARFVRRILEPILPRAKALTNNFCAITGTARGVYNADNTTTLTFSPQSLLDANKKYYVIIKGDSNLTDAQKEGVLSSYEVTIRDSWPDLDGNGTAGEDNDRILNGVKFYGYVWSFTTRDDGQNNGICTIGRVEISPDSYLFQTTEDALNEDDSDPNENSFDTIKDRDKVFMARAISSDGQELAPVAGVYFWDWTWNYDGSMNTSVVNYDTVNPYSTVPPMSERQLFEAQSGITDGFSRITVEAQVSGSAASPNESYQGEAQVWVFVCENPWPPVDPATGLWAPWSDIVEGMSCLPGTGSCFSTNYELYYCRDLAGTGTADDLPAILSASTIIRGSSTAQNILKEYYFFREPAPSVSGGISLTLVDRTTTTDGRVFVYWNAVAGANGYKVYYGAQSGSYSDYQDIKGATNVLINNLTVGQTYYFTVTAYYSTGAESGYSAEESITPEDKTSPLTPAGLVETALACDGKAFLSWNANTDDTEGYKVYYGANSGVYGGVEDVKEATQVTISGLTNDTTYYFVVTAYDAYNNESGYSNELGTVVMSDCDILILKQTFNNEDMDWSQTNAEARDRSGYDNNGDVIGAVTASGIISEALEFDGLNDYVEIASNPSLKYTGGEITLSAWIKAEPTEALGNILSKPWNGSGEYNYQLVFDSNFIILSLRGSTDYFLISSETISAGSWNYIVATIDILRNVKIYINGEESISGVYNITDWSPVNDIDRDVPLAIGTLFPYGDGWDGMYQGVPAYGFSFEGMIDEVRIYSQALSADAVLALYKSYNP